MNFVRRYLLERELRALEYKVERHYALSVRKAELETTQSNVIKKLCNEWESRHVVPEYDTLSEQIPIIKSRIEEIKEELRMK